MKFRISLVAAGLLVMAGLGLSMTNVEAEEPYPDPRLLSGVPVNLCRDFDFNGPGCDVILGSTQTSEIFYPGPNYTLPGAFQLDLATVDLSYIENSRFIADYGLTDVFPGDPIAGFGYGTIWQEDNPDIDFISPTEYAAKFYSSKGTFDSTPFNFRDFRINADDPGGSQGMVTFQGSRVIIDLGEYAAPIQGLSQFGGQIWGMQTPYSN